MSAVGRYLALVLIGTFCPRCASPPGQLFPPLATPMVWPQPPDAPRIRLVGVIASSDDLKAARTGREALSEALHGRPDPIRFLGPQSVAVADGRLVAVADGNATAVHIIDLTARTHLLVTGFAGERFGSPVCVAWAGTRLYISDALRHEVIELSAEGAFVRRFGADTLSRPVGIVYAAPHDRLYVVDGGAHCIRVFTPDGRLDRTIGQRGASAGEFNYPSYVAYRPDVLAVADSGNFRVQLLSPDGVCERTIGQKGDAAGDFALPKGVAFDPDGHLYAVDAHFENVQVFDREGRLLLAFGQEGSGLGAFSLPAGVAIEPHGRIWVADAGNGRLQVFEYIGAAAEGLARHE